MDRDRALAEFDRQHNIGHRVHLTRIDIPFWEWVALFFKAWVALIVTGLVIAALVGIVAFGFALLTNR